MSALPLKADIVHGGGMSALCQKRTSADSTDYPFCGGGTLRPKDKKQRPPRTLPKL
jgi:hypothetical protein